MNFHKNSKRNDEFIKPGVFRLFGEYIGGWFKSRRKTKLLSVRDQPILKQSLYRCLEEISGWGWVGRRNNGQYIWVVGCIPNHSSLPDSYRVFVYEWAGPFPDRLSPLTFESTTNVPPEQKDDPIIAFERFCHCLPIYPVFADFIAFLSTEKKFIWQCEAMVELNFCLQWTQSVVLFTLVTSYDYPTLSYSLYYYLYVQQTLLNRIFLLATTFLGSPPFRFLSSFRGIISLKTLVDFARNWDRRWTHMTSLEWSHARTRVTSYFPCVKGRMPFLLTDTACLKSPAGPSLTGAIVM